MDARYILMQLVALWREVNASMVLLEFHNEDEADSMIDHTNRVPDELVKKYMTGRY